MNNLALKVVVLLKLITERLENILQFQFSGSTRNDVEEKIETLYEERNKIYIRYSHFVRLRRLKEHGVSFEHLKSFEDKVLTENETFEIYKSLEVLDSLLETQQKIASANKNETVVNLYLLKEKKKYFKGKVISVFSLMLSAISIIFFAIPYWSIFIGVALYVLFEAKDQVVSYRVSKGFFGTTTSEAIELIKFIRKNINDLDSGDGGGAKRKILNPIKDTIPDDSLTQGELPNV